MKIFLGNFYRKFLLSYCVVLLTLAFNVAKANEVSEKILFWNGIKKGANVFNRHIEQQDIKAAKDFGIAFIRLSPDKFPTKNRDFLIGNADNYGSLAADDLKLLKRNLDIFAQEKVPVILTMLSLPGSRWKQKNNNQDDLRLWDSEGYQKQAAKFWKDLASELKDHPAIVGYNILNEPHPERLYDSKAIHISDINQKEVQNKLFNFYGLVITSIRSVDKNTPILLDSSAYGDPTTFQYFRIHNDPNIIYSFHMYEPFEYTNKKLNGGKYSYPGKVRNIHWDKEALKNYMQPVIDFQKRHKIPSNKILVGEFGCNRMSKGLPNYFKDLLEIFTDEGWHFAFYAFREDNWDGMDYELGTKKLPKGYWQAIENGDKIKLDRKDNNPQFNVLKDALKNPT